METQITENQTGGLTKYRVLIGALMVQLILGTVYGYSIFWQPLSAEVFPSMLTESEAVSLRAEGQSLEGYDIVKDEAEREQRVSVQRGYLKYAFSICILSFALTMIVAGRIQDVKGPRFPAIIGAVLLGIGFILAALFHNSIVFYLAHAAFTGTVTVILLMVYHAVFGKMDMKQMPILTYIPLGIVACSVVAGVTLGTQYVGKLEELDQLFLLWGTIGFLAGAGIGFAYVCPIAALVKWFPEHKGLVSGLAVAGFGFGAYIFKGDTIGAQGYLQAHGMSSFFLVHGVTCLVIVTLGALLLCNPPSVVSTAQSKLTEMSQLVWFDMLKRPAFYVIWLMFFSGAMAGLMVIGIVKVFAGEQLVSAAQVAGTALADAEVQDLLAKGAAAVGWLAIFNALGRIAWGFVSDKVGRTAAFVAMFSFQAVVLFFLDSINSEIGLAVAASIIGFNFGGNFALFPSVTADTFGAKNLGANYGWIFTSYGIAGVVGIAAGNAAKTITGSYRAAFILAAVLCLVSAGLAVALSTSIKRQRALPV